MKNERALSSCPNCQEDRAWALVPSLQNGIPCFSCYICCAGWKTTWEAYNKAIQDQKNRGGEINNEEILTDFFF